MPNQITSRQLRSFGFTVGGVFALIALWPLIVRADDPRWWAAVISAGLLLPAAVYPASLRQVYTGWMALGHVLGWINTRIILGFIFYLIVTPIGIVRRWLGKDPMGRRLSPHLKSYRLARTSRPASHLTKQY